MSKSQAAKAVTLEPVFVEIKKTRQVRHNSPITFDGYIKSDGTPRKMRFEEGEEGFKQYGARIYNLRVDDSGVVLNLANALDNKRFQIASEMKELGLFPFEAQDQLVDIIEPEKEDLASVEKFDRKLKAAKIISEELGDIKDLRQFAFYFGLADGKDVTVRKHMIELAENDPEQFIEGWENPFRHLMVLTRKAIDKGLITLRADTNIYFYADKLLGSNYEEIVNTLAKDSALTAVLNSKV